MLAELAPGLGVPPLPTPQCFLSMRDPIWVPVLAKHKRAGSFQSHGLLTRSEALNSILYRASFCTHTPTPTQSHPLAKFERGQIKALFTLPHSYSKQMSRRPTTHTLRRDTQAYSHPQTEIPTPETDSHTQELHSTSDPRAWGFGQGAPLVVWGWQLKCPQKVPGRLGPLGWAGWVAASPICPFISFFRAQYQGTRGGSGRAYLLL